MKNYYKTVAFAMLMILTVSTALQAQKANKNAKTQKMDQEHFGEDNVAFLDSLNDEDLTPSLKFVGKGDLQKSISEGADIPTSTGIGFQLIEKFDKPILFGLVYQAEVEGQINVSTQAEDLVAKLDNDNMVINQSDFGSAVLTPLIGNQAVNLSVRAYFLPERRKSSGLGLLSWIKGAQASYIGSNRRVVKQDTAINVTVNSFRLGIFHEFLHPDYRDDYSIALGGAFAYNSIRGDMAQSDNDDLREQLFKSMKKSFTGAEVFLHIRFQNIRAKFEYSILSPDSEVPGLTGGRMVTTISFVGGFPVKLKPKS